MYSRSHSSHTGRSAAPDTDTAGLHARTVDADTLSRTVTVCVLVPHYYRVGVRTRGPAEACTLAVQAVQAGRFKGALRPEHASEPIVLAVHTVPAHSSPPGDGRAETVPEAFVRAPFARALRRLLERFL